MLVLPGHKSFIRRASKLNLCQLELFQILIGIGTVDGSEIRRSPPFGCTESLVNKGDKLPTSTGERWISSTINRMTPHIDQLSTSSTMTGSGQLESPPGGFCIRRLLGASKF